MKKILLSVAVLAAVALASCSSATQKAEDKGADLKAKIENCTDPDSLKIYVQQAQDYAEQLVKEGKDQAAADYLNEVAPILEAKDAKNAGLLDKLKQEADSAYAKGEAAVDSVKAGVSDAVENAGDKASAVVAGAKDEASKAAGKAEDAVKNAADKTTDAAKAVAGKTEDAAKSAADKAKEAEKAVKGVFK